MRKSLFFFERFYEDLQDLLELTPKKHVLFIIGEGMQKLKFKCYLEQQAGLALEYKMKKGRLTEFCQENTLVIVNTLFQQHKRRLYTRTSPDGQHRNQIDYTLQPKMEKLYTVSQNKIWSFL